MKVLIISHLWPGNPQSVNPLSGIYVKEQVDALKIRAEIDVAVPVMLFPNTGEILKKKICPVVRLLWKENRVNPVKYIPFISKHLNGIIIGLQSYLGLKHDYDLIHAHTVFPDGIAAAVMSAMTHKPFIITVHGSEIMFIKKRPLDRLIARFIMNRASCIISVSKKMGDIIKHIGVSTDIRIIRNGITKPFAKSTGDDFLFVGKLIDVKDPLMLIDAYSIYIKSGGKKNLILAGDGNLRQKVEQAVKDRNLEKRVTLNGFVSRDKMKDIYANSCMLVISSKSEGFPTILFEAMSAGMPVISYDIGGIAEVIDDKRGIIAEERTAEALAEAMMRADKHIWDNDAIKAYASEFTWERISEKILEVYGEIKKGA